MRIILNVLSLTTSVCFKKLLFSITFEIINMSTLPKFIMVIIQLITMQYILIVLTFFSSSVSVQRRFNGRLPLVVSLLQVFHRQHKLDGGEMFAIGFEIFQVCIAYICIALYYNSLIPHVFFKTVKIISEM